MDIVDVKSRSRAGSWSSFVKRYEPIKSPRGTTMWEREELPDGVDKRRIWTAVDGDRNLYVVAGYSIVDRVAYLVTTHGWSDIEYANAGYLV